jgi:hypothetical protein
VLYAYDVNATDPDGDTLTYSLITRPTGMTINSANGLIKWIPVAAQFGNNSVTVKVSDGSLSIIQSFIIKVSKPTPTPINHAPVIYSTQITTATVGVGYVYDVNAIDPDGDTLNYSLTANPSGMFINSVNGLIWWVPSSVQVGNNLVTVMVSDGVLIDIQGFTITVSKPTPTPINQAPVITSIPDDTAIVGTEYIYEVKATDSDGDILNYSLDVKPTDMTINSTNGLIRWTPVAAQVGDNPVTVKVSDGSLSDTESFEIIVTIKVVEIITIHWLEAAVRYNALGEVTNSWSNDSVPPLDEWCPAELILTDGEYHFADVKDFFNIYALPDTEGSVFIDETGLLSGYATYTLGNGFPCQSDFEGQVEIIIYEEAIEIEEVLLDGTMVGTYTQWKYVFGTEEKVKAVYKEAVLCEGSEVKWFVGHTIYFPHGEETIKKL